MKNFSLIFIFLLGSFLIPTITYACGKKSVAKCCEVSTSEKSEKKECCKKKSEQSDNSCDGKCGKSSCACPTVISSTLLSFDVAIETLQLNKILLEKNSFHYVEIYISSAFDKLRLPPKIG